MPPCSTLRIIMYESRVSGAIQETELHPPLQLVVVAIEKEAFGLPSTIISQLYLYIYIYIYIYIY